MATPGLGRKVRRRTMAHTARRAVRNTLIVVDPTDVHKPHAPAMPHLSTVLDGRTGQLVDDYWARVSPAC